MGRLRSRKLSRRAAIFLSGTVIAGVVAVLAIVVIGALNGVPDPVEAQDSFSSLDAITKRAIQITSGAYYYELQMPSPLDVTLFSAPASTGESDAHPSKIGSSAWGVPGKDALMVSERIYSRLGDDNLEAIISAGPGADETFRSEPLRISGGPDADQHESNGVIGVAPLSVASPTQAGPGGNGTIETPSGPQTTQSIQIDPGSNGAFDIPAGTEQEPAGVANAKPEGDLESNGAVAADAGG